MANENTPIGINDLTLYDDLIKNYINSEIPEKATASADGLMSKEDFSKLSNVAANANNYSLPTASTETLGGVKVDGTTITISNGVISSAGGNGSTTVVANPVGAATSGLAKIQVGETIYSIDNVTGNSYSKTLLWGNGTIAYPATKPTDAQLSDDYINYDELEIVCGWAADNIKTIVNAKCSPTILHSLDNTNYTNISEHILISVNPGSDQWVRMYKGSIDDIIHFSYESNVGIYQIWGIKYGGGNLDSLSNVNISSPSNAQILKYDSSTQRWVNSTDFVFTSTLGTSDSSVIPNLNDITDTGIYYIIGYCYNYCGIGNPAILFVFNTGNDYVTQVLFRGYGGHIYFREYFAGDRNYWTEWVVPSTSKDLNNSNNLNDLEGYDAIGDYKWLLSLPTNAPAGNCSMHVTYTGGRTIQEVTDGERVWRRYKTNGSSSWENWYLFEGTVVSS